jgi:aspartate/methionine/tyrosine aminotransferase
MAGWRVGMVLGNAKAIDAILKVKSNMDSGMFSFKRSNCCDEIYKKTPRFDGAVS